ncbi:MAG TPA: hypothetical protein VH500_01530 [Nitrososphaeraceae archaeon]
MNINNAALVIVFVGLVAISIANQPLEDIYAKYRKDKVSFEAGLNESLM